MAPPAKRRKRNVVEDSDAEDDGPATRTASNGNSNNTLKRYLFSSPRSNKASSRSPPPGNSRVPSPSPSPLRKINTRSSSARQTAAAAAAAVLPTPSVVMPRARSVKTPTKSPSTSPEKSRARGQKKGKIEESGKTADLVTLFSRQSQRSQPSSIQLNCSKDSKTLGLEEIISDPISEEDDVGLNKTVGSSIVSKNAQKRFRPDGTQPVAAAAAGSATLNTSSARFLKPPRPAVVAKPVDDDLRPWSERFAPLNLEELAVHKRKVADVRKWLEDVFDGRMRQRLLVLKGAAGTGKTTTVKLLARDMHFDVLEWRNPANILGATHGYQSASAQFEEFLGRGGKFGQLDVDSDTASDSQAASATDSGRRLILIEEFPNTFMRSSSVLTSFRNTILQFLVANTPALATFGYRHSTEPIIPVVMVISETLLTTTSASADSFTAHRLLGPEILRHPGTGLIEFNPIAPTILAKALELVVQKEARKSGRRRTPGPLVLQRLGEIGDIRNAIASLEFLCVKGDEEADWGAKVAFSKPKKGAKDVPAMTKSEQDSLELISQREASLGIFHAVGKVVYNKRDELPYPPGSAEAEAETLPDYLAHFSRPKRSQVSVDTLIDETGTDTHTFISALHENYALSCEQSGPADSNCSLDYINGCIEYLSESDLLCPSWDIFFGGRGFPGGGYVGRDSGSHIVRQDEMAFQTAVRGLLLSLPSPVRRQSHPTGGRGGGDAFKMFYPTSLKLWRAKEELEGLIDMWATRMLTSADAGTTSQPGGSFTSGTSNPMSMSSKSGSGSGYGAFKRPQKRGGGSSVGDRITSNPALNYTPTQLSKLNAEQKAASDSAAPPPLLSLGTSARQELLLERLPYMAHIARGRRGGTGSSVVRLRDLEKIVTFQGIGPPKTEDEDDEESGAGIEDDERGVASARSGENWATDRPSEESSPRGKRRRGLGAILQRGRTRIGESEMPVVTMSPVSSGLSGMQGLVISDDDIED